MLSYTQSSSSPEVSLQCVQERSAQCMFRFLDTYITKQENQPNPEDAAALWRSSYRYRMSPVLACLLVVIMCFKVLCWRTSTIWGRTPLLKQLQTTSSCSVALLVCWNFTFIIFCLPKQQKNKHQSSETHKTTNNRVEKNKITSRCLAG